MNAAGPAEATPRTDVRRHVLQLTMAIAIVAIPLIAVFATNTTPQLGLDLQGGISVVLAPKAGVKVKSDTLGQAVKIIRNRVDSLSVRRESSRIAPGS